MEICLVGYNILGYRTEDVKSETLNTTGNDIIVVLSENVDNLKDYYKLIDNNIKNGGRTILIGVGEQSEQFKVLAALMTSFRRYDIYNVVDKSVITPNYINQIIGRYPTFTEVQTYIGGDVTAYAELSTIMFGIDDLVHQGDLDRLTSFLSQHMQSIENLVHSIDYMKTICESYNISELADQIEDIQKEANSYKEDLSKANSKMLKLQADKEKMEKDLAQLRETVSTLKSTNEELKKNAENGAGAIVSTFVECNTTLLKCKVKNIVYFKEISYLPYINTLINSLMFIWQRGGRKVKLMIYDNRTEFYKIYKGIGTYSGKTYATNKENLMKRTERFVVSEPIQSIITDALTSDSAPDILIVYDRMKTTKDVVIGNNVAKFFVLNTKTEYETLMSDLKIVDESSIITRSDSEFSQLALDIPYIPNFKGGTDSAKIQKYNKLVTTISKKPLLKELTVKARL